MVVVRHCLWLPMTVSGSANCIHFEDGILNIFEEIARNLLMRVCGHRHSNFSSIARSFLLLLFINGDCFISRFFSFISADGDENEKNICRRAFGAHNAGGRQELLRTIWTGKCNPLPNLYISLSKIENNKKLFSRRRKKMHNAEVCTLCVRAVFTFIVDKKMK